MLDIATTTGIVVARHRLAADGAGVTVRDHGHVAALDGRGDGRRSRGPGAAPPQGTHPTRPAARAAARVLRGEPQQPLSPVIDLAAYEQAAKNRNTLT